VIVSIMQRTHTMQGFPTLRRCYATTAFVTTADSITDNTTCSDGYRANAITVNTV
jgi:hypothetical protein